MEELLFVTSDSLKAQLVTEALKEQGIPCYRKDLGAGQFLNIYFGMFRLRFAITRPPLTSIT